MALILLACWPAWPYLWARWLDGSDEPLGVVAALLLLWLSRSPPIEPVNPKIARLWLALYAALCLWTPPLVGAALAMLCLTAVACQTRHGQVKPGWLGLALLSLPSLASLQFFLGYPARLAAAQCACWLLALQGFQVERRGVELLWRGRHLLVDTPCSGLATLWMMMFFAMGLAAVRNLGWGQTIRLAGLALGLAWAANLLRLTGLFYSELILNRPELHTPIGLVGCGLGAALLWALCPGPGPTVGPSPSQQTRQTFWGLALTVALLGFVNGSPPAAVDFPGWPKQLAGRPLQLLEEVDVAGFPGRIGRFEACGEGIVLRWVNRPTRMLHSSADCFRARGVTFQGSEKIYDADGHCFDDVSQWFWSAASGRSRGPWLAVTRSTSYAKAAK